MCDVTASQSRPARCRVSRLQTSSKKSNSVTSYVDATVFERTFPVLMDKSTNARSRRTVPSSQDSPLLKSRGKWHPVELGSEEDCSHSHRRAVKLVPLALTRPVAATLSPECSVQSAASPEQQQRRRVIEPLEFVRPSHLQPNQFAYIDACEYPPRVDITHHRAPFLKELKDTAFTTGDATNPVILTNNEPDLMPAPKNALKKIKPVGKGKNVARKTRSSRCHLKPADVCRKKRYPALKFSGDGDAIQRFPFSTAKAQKLHRPALNQNLVNVKQNCLYLPPRDAEKAKDPMNKQLRFASAVDAAAMVLVPDTELAVPNPLPGILETEIDLLRNNVLVPLSTGFDSTEPSQIGNGLPIGCVEQQRAPSTLVYESYQQSNGESAMCSESFFSHPTFFNVEPNEISVNEQSWFNPTQAVYELVELNGSQRIVHVEARCSGKAPHADHSSTSAAAYLKYRQANSQPGEEREPSANAIFSFRGGFYQQAQLIPSSFEKPIAILRAHDGKCEKVAIHNVREFQQWFKEAMIMQ